jgi:hypothetical protein
MATLRWKPASLNKKQTYTITVANTWAQNDTATITIDNVAFIVTIGTLVTTAQVATTIQQALSGTTLTDTSASCTIAVADGGAALIPQFSEFTATVSSSVVTLTGNGTGALAGRPPSLKPRPELEPPRALPALPPRANTTPRRPITGGTPRSPITTRLSGTRACSTPATT